MITFFFKNLLPHIGRFEQKNVLQKFQRKMRKAKENIWFYLSIQIIVIVEKEKYDLFLDHRQSQRVVGFKVFKLTSIYIHSWIVPTMNFDQYVIVYFLFESSTQFFVIIFHFLYSYKYHKL